MKFIEKSIEAILYTGENKEEVINTFPNLCFIENNELRITMGRYNTKIPINYYILLLHNKPQLQEKNFFESKYMPI